MEYIEVDKKNFCGIGNFIVSFKNDIVISLFDKGSVEIKENFLNVMEPVGEYENLSVDVMVDMDNTGIYEYAFYRIYNHVKETKKTFLEAQRVYNKLEREILRLEDDETFLLDKVVSGSYHFFLTETGKLMMHLFTLYGVEYIQFENDVQYQFHMPFRDLFSLISENEYSAYKRYVNNYNRNTMITINSEIDIAWQEAAITDLCEEEEKEKLWPLYYDAWKLRGDSPRMYMEYEIPHCSLMFEEELRRDLDNIRNIKQCRNFYKYYHFNKGVRKNGKKPEIFEVSDDFIKLIRKIQIELREDLNRRQIGIECNPTSNYRIGAFSRFDEHPMFQMYGKNLNDVPSSRMCVSINTDDMGIFQTSLEMEYVTMYVALLKCKDENGNAKYSKEEIEKWLEDVKEFGHVQSFKTENLYI